MKVSRFEPRNCWRVQVPARWSDDRKPHAHYFKTKEAGNAFIAEKYNHPASNYSVHMPMSDRVFLENLRSLLGSNDAIQQAVDFYRKTVLSVQKHGTVFDLIAEYQAWQETMNRTPDGIKAINHWARKFVAVFGNQMVTGLNYSDLSKWINSHPGGKGHSGRRNAYVFTHALLNWAQKNGWLAQDILKGMDKPGVNVLKNIMPVAHFAKMLAACAASDEFRSILPILVLKGLAGVRDCELVGKRINQPDVIFWEDFNWAKGWLFIRDEVAKQTTRKSGDQRWVTLPPAALEWLKPLAQKSGPVFAGNRDTFGETKLAMLKSVKLKMERNTLRHSYATYSITCGSLAAAAKNMGDTESRVKSTYENPDIEPETGLAWFALRPGSPGNVVQIGTAA